MLKRSYALVCRPNEATHNGQLITWASYPRVNLEEIAQEQQRLKREKEKEKEEKGHAGAGSSVPAPTSPAGPTAEESHADGAEGQGEGTPQQGESEGSDAVEEISSFTSTRAARLRSPTPDVREVPTSAAVLARVRAEEQDIVEVHPPIDLTADSESSSDSQFLHHFEYDSEGASTDATQPGDTPVPHWMYEEL